MTRLERATYKNYKRILNILKKRIKHKIGKKFISESEKEHREKNNKIKLFLQQDRLEIIQWIKCMTIIFSRLNQRLKVYLERI